MVTPISKHHINNEINNEKENNCLLKSYYRKNGHLIIIEKIEMMTSFMIMLSTICMKNFN
jgi:hypothetical protein